MTALRARSCRRMLLAFPSEQAEPIPAEAQALAARAYREQRQRTVTSRPELGARAAALAPDWVTRSVPPARGARGVAGPEVERAARERAASALGAYLHARLLLPADDPFAAVARAGSAWARTAAGPSPPGGRSRGRHPGATRWSARAASWIAPFPQGLARALTATGDAGRAQALLLLRRAYLRCPRTLLRAELLLMHRDTWGAEGEHEAERRWWRAAAPGCATRA